MHCRTLLIRSPRTTILEKSFAFVLNMHLNQICFVKHFSPIKHSMVQTEIEQPRQMSYKDCHLRLHAFVNKPLYKESTCRQQEAIRIVICVCPLC